MTDQKYMQPGLQFALGKLIEETGELNAALGKTLRFGWHTCNPETPIPESNLLWVKREMDDVWGAILNLRGEIEKAIETDDF